MSIMELISEINDSGTTIIMVTHDPTLAALARRNVHIRDGRLSDLSSDAQLARVAAS
jgi:putative ABC transport system ATP-binding protein